MHVVIVGNGVAGIEAAQVVRAGAPDWKITVVSEESDHFFSRTALMYVLSGQMSHRDIEPLPRDLYQRLGLERLRARAIGLDVAAKKLLLAGGAALSFDKLLVACGSKPRPPPWPGAELAGIGHFVTLQDLEWLEREIYGENKRRPPRADEHLATSPPGSPYRPRPAAREIRGRAPKSCAVIGGGLIGAEVVETLIAAGHKPRFVIREDWFWPMAIDSREAAWIAEKFRDHGVEVMLSQLVDRFLGDDRGCLSELAIVPGAGRVPCELAVVAIGVMPSTDWIGSALELSSGGIVVDAGLRASAPDVFAAGDCAAVTWHDGGRRPEQLWYTARAQGRVAGRRLLGEDVTYRRGTWYNSAKLMDVEYTTAGVVPSALTSEEWFYEERGKVRSTTRIVVKDGAITGFNALGRRWDHEPICRWIEEGRSLVWVLDHLREAAFDTEFVPPLVIPREARR